MKIVLAVDPGKTTGLAVLSYDTEPELVSSHELSQFEFGRVIDEFFQTVELKHVEVVCERFVINAQTVKNSQAPFSLEQIGILKYLVHRHGLDPEKIYFQSPSDAKKLFPNEALKKLDMWHKGGGGHALDAVRHGLLRLAKTGWLPRVLLDRE